MKTRTKNNIIIYICLIVIIVAVIVIAFSIFNSQPKKVEKEYVNAGNVSMTYASDYSGLSLMKMTPTSDITGMKYDTADRYFDFTIATEVENDATVVYEISLLKNTAITNIQNDDIKVYLEKLKDGSYVKVIGPITYSPISSSSEIGSPKNSMILATVTKTSSDNETYRLRVWLSDTAKIPAETSAQFQGKVSVNGKAE